MNFTNPLNPCNERAEDRLAAGVCMLVADLLVALGLALQKRSFDADRPRIIWGFGLFWVLGGMALSLAAYAYAPIVFVVPLFAFTNLYSVPLARCINGEDHVDLYMSTYVSMLTIGCLLTSLAASVCAPPVAPDMLALGIFTGPYWLGVIVLAGIVWRAHGYIRRDETKGQEFQQRLAIYRAAYPLLAAALLVYAIILCRTVVLRTDLWALSFVIVGLVVAVLYVLNLANYARIYEHVVIVPQFVAYTVVIAAVSGPAVFNEFGLFAASQALMFIFGLMVTVASAHAVNVEPTTWKRVPEVELGNPR